MDKMEEWAVAIVREYNINGYETLSKELQENPLVLEAMYQEIDNGNIKALNITTFSTLKRLEAKRIVENLHNQVQWEDRIYSDLLELYKKLSPRAMEYVDRVLIEVSEFPDTYFSINADIKYFPQISKYLKQVFKSYRKFLGVYNKENDYEYTDSIESYMKIYDDIELEMDWGLERLKKTNKAVKKIIGGKK